MCESVMCKYLQAYNMCIYICARVCVGGGGGGGSIGWDITKMYAYGTCTLYPSIGGLFKAKYACLVSDSTSYIQTN